MKSPAIKLSVLLLVSTVVRGAYFEQCHERCSNDKQNEHRKGSCLRKCLKELSAIETSQNPFISRFDEQEISGSVPHYCNDQCVIEQMEFEKSLSEITSNCCSIQKLLQDKVINHLQENAINKEYLIMDFYNNNNKNFVRETINQQCLKQCSSPSDEVCWDNCKNGVRDTFQNIINQKLCSAKSNQIQNIEDTCVARHEDQFQKLTHLLSATYEGLSFGEENMQSYYKCIIGCTPKDPQCRNVCAIRALNIEVQTTLPDASANKQEIQICHPDDLDCYFHQLNKFNYNETDIRNYKKCQNSCVNNIGCSMECLLKILQPKIDLLLTQKVLNMAQKMSEETGETVTKEEIEDALMNELVQSHNISQVLSKIEIEIYQHSKLKYDQCILTCSKNDISCLSACFDFLPQTLFTQEEAVEKEQNYQWQMQLAGLSEKTSGSCMNDCFWEYKHQPIGFILRQCIQTRCKGPNIDILKQDVAQMQVKLSSLPIVKEVPQQELLMNCEQKQCEGECLKLTNLFTYDTVKSCLINKCMCQQSYKIQTFLKSPNINLQYTQISPFYFLVIGLLLVILGMAFKWWSRKKIRSFLPQPLLQQIY